ncbi:T-cell leukemia homeobox protein 1-like [Pocillopora damicornis]|uniref:T-cell leukemia homeobox protein 1-like n=1 Tax=Pocillopora damicornis TaxID=46731 RepID=UPI000F54DED6|nr:T-cell leukemia homeobox protein 1-like [Pocillopora damicornis]
MAFYHVYQSGAGSTSSSRIMDEPSACPGCLYAEPVTISVVQNVTAHSFPKETSTVIRVNPTREPQKKREGPVKEPVKCTRVQFTVYQRCVLEKTFSLSQYISAQKRLALSQELGISCEKIQTWFKNRRVKWRKEERQTGEGLAPASLRTGPYFTYLGHVPYPNSKLMVRDARMLLGSPQASYISKS